MGIGKVVSAAKASNFLDPFQDGVDIMMCLACLPTGATAGDDMRGTVRAKPRGCRGVDERDGRVDLGGAAGSCEGALFVFVLQLYW